MTDDRLEIEIQYIHHTRGDPAAEYIEDCARHALAGIRGELAIRIVDERESADLNERFRGKAGPTNVLAFPAGELVGNDAGLRPLGDIAICGPVVAREAHEQNKALEAHWAHIVIHGCLHLLGYDHLTAEDAAEMESRERTILAGLGIGDPYESRN